MWRFLGDTSDTRPVWELHSEVTTAESRREHRENLRPPEPFGELRRVRAEKVIKMAVS